MAHLDYFIEALPGCKQEAVAQHSAEKGYTDQPLVMVAGAAEELGEVAREVLLLSPEYVSKPGKELGDLKHEIIDTIVYLCGLANFYGIDLGI